MRPAAGAELTPARWSTVLRALREAAGATQEGWAARLGVGRSTLQRWESGDTPPSPEVETAVLEACRDRGLFRTFYQGPLRGLTVTPELVRDLLAEARLAGAPSRAQRAPRAPVSRPAPPRTTFIGRERELAEIQRLLGDTRLVTLTGPGGAGKTRLALQVSSAVGDHYQDGVWLLDLSQLSDQNLIVPELATTLGLRQQTDESLLEAITTRLGQTRALLVVDNCEHLLVPSAQLIDRLLADCLELRVLATSRQPLSIADEACWPVTGLPRREAVTLFAERAVAVRPDFTITDDNAEQIASICERLDGLPLAIELAAARTRVLAPAQLASRLDNHLRVLASTNPTAAPRQQTLRATLDWSYELLTPPERALLRRVSVFAAGWTLEAAEAVADEPAEVLDLLSSLVLKSLVIADLNDGNARYRLLETVRQYATEKLSLAREDTSARDRHLRWCRALVDAAEPHLRAAQQAAWLEQLEAELENIRAALTWALATRERVSDGLRIAAALRWFWFTRGRPAEGRAWLERGLAQDADVAVSVRARALDSAAALAHSQGAYAASRELQEAALELWRREGDRPRIASALSTLGIVAKAQGELATARELMGEALSVAREVGDRSTEATVLNNLAALTMDVSDYVAARDLLQQSLAIKRELADAAGIATSLFNLGETAVRLGEYADALELLSESLALFRRLSAAQRIAQTLHSLGSVALRQGDHAAARAQFTEALELFKSAGDAWGQALCVEGLGEAASAAGEHEQAARLFGAAAAWRDANGAPVPPNDRDSYDEALARASAGLTQTAFAIAWAEGRSLGLDVAT